eukprot:15455298-Alexandrium_andersonii.AAC.1
MRDLHSPLLAAWDAHVDGGQQVHKHISLALRATARPEELMDIHKEEAKWPEPARKELATNVHNFLALQAAIAHHYHGRGQQLFLATMKSHSR